MKKWIPIAFIVALVVLTFSVAAGFYFSNSATQSSAAEPWMFKDAYATYTGEINSPSILVKLKLVMQVTDVNASHVQVKTNSTITSSFSPSLTDQTVIWIDRANIQFQPKGETIAKTYNTQIAVKSIGTRSCTVYECTNAAINATYYIDDSVVWPLRIVYVTGFENQTYTLSFNLYDTNIKVLS